MTEKRLPSATIGDLRGGISSLSLPVDEDGAVPSKAKPMRLSEKRIPSGPVRELCGGVSDMTLWRWLHNAEVGFPRPVYIAKRRYWREADIIAWLDAQSAQDMA